MRRLKTSIPPPSQDDIDRFLNETGFFLPPPYIELLAACGNGGPPIETIAYYVPALHDGGIVHALIGINRDTRLYDLRWHMHLDFNVTLWGKYLPFALDDGGDQVLINTQMKQFDIWYRPWDMIANNLEESIFKVADSMTDFVEALMKPERLQARLEAEMEGIDNASGSTPSIE